MGQTSITKSLPDFPDMFGPLFDWHFGIKNFSKAFKEKCKKCKVELI